MRSILETCEPRPDILKGTFNPEIFTASLSQVVDSYRGKAVDIHNLYTDADQFFSSATYATDNMRNVLSEVMARLSGDSSVAAIHRLETAFGGGKTHTLIALTHLGFRGSELADVAASCFKKDIFGPARLHRPGDVSVVGVAGDEISVHRPQGASLVPYTLWGEIAFQLGGEALYREIEVNATSYAAPGEAFLERIFAGRKVILMLDELAQYATRLSAAHPGGSDQLAAFMLALQGYARTHAGIAIVLTLASSSDAFSGQTEHLRKLLGNIRGEEVSAQDAKLMFEKEQKGVASVVARDATGVIPVQPNEISRVLAKRLFVRIDAPAAAETIQAYLDMYAKNAGLLPDRATRAAFRDTLNELFPFHPAFIDFLNRKMSTLENFQGTRGVLRILALAIRSLWRAGRAIPLIHTCHLDLRDARIVNELVSRTGGGELLPILNTDIGGVDTGSLAAGTSRAEEADRKNPHPEDFPLHEYTWKTVFLHSLVGRNEGLASNLFGINERDAMFEVSFPGLTPPQVQTALEAIEDSDRGAFYLRHSKQYGRWYASLDASINRALATIRASLEEKRIAEHLAVVARKVVADDKRFRVTHDVSLPEHIEDKGDRPALGLVAWDLERIDPMAFVTTAGPNRPRIRQNLVLLLVPKTVFIEGDQWSEDRTAHAADARARLRELGGDVIARTQLKNHPQDYGIKKRQLDEEEFHAKTAERENALLTTMTELYDGLCYPGSVGQVARKEIRTAGGESGASVLEQVRGVLLADGKLVDEQRARTKEVLTDLGRLYFGIGQTPGLQALRKHFAEKRTWPILETPAVFDHALREGIGRGLWCLFRMHSEDSLQPAVVYCRDTDPVPFTTDLHQDGWSLVTLAGAKKRGWLGGEVEVDPIKIEQWVRDTIREDRPAARVAEIVDKVVEEHGDVPESAILNAVDSVVRADHAVAFSGTPDQQDPPARLVRGAAASFHSVARDDVIVSPAEASRRGWISVEPKRFEIQGKDAADRFIPLLRRLDSLYGRGAKSPFAVLDLVELRLQDGGRLRLNLQGASAKDMKALGQLFEDLADVASPDERTQARIRIDDPDETCPLFKELNK